MTDQIKNYKNLLEFQFRKNDGKVGQIKIQINQSFFCTSRWQAYSIQFRRQP